MPPRMLKAIVASTTRKLLPRMAISSLLFDHLADRACSTNLTGTFQADYSKISAAAARLASHTSSSRRATRGSQGEASLFGLLLLRNLLLQLSRLRRFGWRSDVGRPFYGGSSILQL